MTHHDNNLHALKAAGDHLRTKDGESDPFEMLAKKFGDMTDATLKRMDHASQALEELDERLDYIEKVANRPGAGAKAAMTWGEELTRKGAGELADLSRSGRGQVGVEVKSITSVGASAGSLDIPQRDALVPMPRQRLMVRDVLNVIGTSSGTIEYAVQTARTNAAAPVAEGALKPESNYAWELRNTPTRVIAHWVKASTQILSDAPQLSDLVDSELRYGLALEEETQILYGDGTGANLLGLIPSATAHVDPLSLASPNGIDKIGTAILQTGLADFVPSAVIMHPADWMRLRLLKDADGHYILGDPQAVVTPNLFGLPVVATKAMALDTFLVGDFLAAATLYDRWQVRVEVGYVNDDFTKNLVTIRAEERVALAVKQSAALTLGDFGNVA